MKKISLWKIAFFLPIPIFFILGSVVFANQLWETPRGAMAENNLSGQDMSLLAATNVPPINCIAGYEDWKKSQIYKVHPQWNIDFMGENTSGKTSSERYFSDINGDGLPDYISVQSYFANASYVSSFIERCVYLNNGSSGWTPIYRCRGTGAVNNGPWTFYGDCAG